ncbi:nose resistant to fluoxetine protein 6-like [Zophobas morio]|uniref:nose resistant to fluoxetine protein 6-like n=1 Tax=Zophobas morio TaxID=2755281 RepID=UPI0030839DDC
MLRLVLVVLVWHWVAAEKSVFKVLENLQPSQKCQQQLGEFVRNWALNENSWALQMMDATSKVPSGILNYNFAEMGDFQQCVQIETSGTTTETILGKYCLGYVSFGNETSNKSKIDTSSIRTTSVLPQAPTWALCLPNGCTSDDANLIGNAVLRALFQQDQIRVDFSDFLCQTTNDVNPSLTIDAIAAITILAILVATVLVSTFYDIYAHHSCPMIIKAFSVYTNGRTIFTTTTPTPDHLSCLNGLKFISMMWIVLGHQFSIPIYGSITNTKYVLQWTDKLHSMVLISATLSVDTFFTISGVLMSYGFMKTKYRSTRFNILFYYCHRYVRLTAPLVPVVLVSATLLKYLGSGPKWPYMFLYFQKNCQLYWWSTLLYVQNYVNISNMCVGQTWYLNVDMQLYLVSPLVLYVLFKYPKVCLPLMGTTTLLSILFTFYVTWQNELSAILSNFYTTHSVDYQNRYYLLTHTRFAPWVIGAVLGYFIFKLKHDEIALAMSRSVVSLAWVVCFGTIVTCIFGGHGTLRGPGYDKWGNALHIALVRPCWSLAIAWVILACTSNNGGVANWILGSSMFQVLNRFTYGIFLTHVTLLYGVAYGRKTPVYFSEFDMVYQFGGTLLLCFGLAVLLVLTTECPAMAVEKILLGKRDKILASTHDLDAEQISLIEERIERDKV